MTSDLHDLIGQQKADLFSRLMADKTLPASAKCVAIALLAKYHDTTPSIGDLTESTAMSRRAVLLALKRLKARGLITAVGAS
jgi:hypothetical protein